MARRPLTSIALLLALSPFASHARDSRVTSLSGKQIGAFVKEVPPAVVHFYAPGDQDAKATQQAFANFCAAYTAVRCGSVNVDNNYNEAKPYNAIPITPYFVFFQLEKIPELVKGAQSTEQLRAKADSLYTAKEESVPEPTLSN